MPAIEKLIQGYQQFHQSDFEEQLYQRLAIDGQAPEIMLITCCDSRLQPVRMLQANPGDIFVLRNIANFIPAATDASHSVAAALEFAVHNLQVKHIIILGHSQCGGIAHLMGGDTSQDTAINKWVTMATPAREQVLKTYSDKPLKEQCVLCEHAAIDLSLQNLSTFPAIKECIDSGQLCTHGWYVDIKSGQLYIKQNDGYQPVSPNP